LIIIEEELRAFIAQDARIFLDTFEKLKNENRALTDVLNETNDKIQNMKQIFRDLNAQETIVIQKREEILQERNEILKQRDILKKKLEKTRTVNEYLITRDTTSASESALASESNLR
jgi:predicted RNase H-like nuclease (RuvC/YqgF family)